MESQAPVILSYEIHYLANKMSILHLAQIYVTEIGERIAATSWEHPVPDKFGAFP